MEKKEEQRSSFITIAINNANSSAVAAGETGERKVAGTGTGGYVHWDCCGQTVKYERGAREGLSPGRVGDCRDPIGSQAVRLSKACCRGVRRALRVSEACKEILISLFSCPWSDSV